MPILGFRPAKAFTLPLLGTGATITDTAINGFEDLMAHLASRGGYAHSQFASSVNGKVRPIAGVVGGLGGGSYAWNQGKISVFWPIQIANGYTSITYFMRYRLGQTMSTPVTRGASLAVDLVLNGVRKRLTTRTYQDADCANDFVNHQGSYQFNERIGNLFKMAIESPTTMFLVVTFDSTSDSTYHGNPTAVGSFTNERFYNGLDYFGFAAFRECEGC